ncbi:MAG: DNA polymerase III subunit chi [Novosphingobium sp.]|nr:DNA polymerase III subunit chi [Novosphingobium sp.]
MRVDFYQLSRDPAEAVVPLLARATINAGEKLLVVSADASQRKRISEGLWSQIPDSFLAHGHAGEGAEARQPILLSDAPEPANEAGFLLLADGLWRDEAAGFDRVFLLFGDAELEGARECWRMLDEQEGTERHFWKQEGGKWREMG